MDWVASIHQAIQYIEEHLREELTIREIAQQAALSPFYFQKGFAMLCGITAGDYIRQRRLSAAGLGPHDGPEDHRHRAGVRLRLAGQLHQGFCPIPRPHTCRTAKKRRRGPFLCSASDQSDIGRWSKHGLQDYEKRVVHGALPGKDVQV